MDPIKEAFDKIKSDISLLTEQIYYLNEQIGYLYQENKDLKVLILEKSNQTHNQTIPTKIPIQTNQ